MAADGDGSRRWRWRPPSVLRLLVVAVVVLNLLDAVFTLIWVESGVATEANLFLEVILSHSAVGFVVVKMSLVSMGVLLLWRERRRRLAVYGIRISFAAYNSLLLYHLGIMAAAVEFA